MAHTHLLTSFTVRCIVGACPAFIVSIFLATGHPGWLPIAITGPLLGAPLFWPSLVTGLALSGLAGTRTIERRRQWWLCAAVATGVAFVLGILLRLHLQPAWSRAVSVGDVLHHAVGIAALPFGVAMIARLTYLIFRKRWLAVEAAVLMSWLSVLAGLWFGVPGLPWDGP
jgi:hypothetical protein